MQLVLSSNLHCIKKKSSNLHDIYCHFLILLLFLLAVNMTSIAIFFFGRKM